MTKMTPGQKRKFFESSGRNLPMLRFPFSFFKKNNSKGARCEKPLAPFAITALPLANLINTVSKEILTSPLYISENFL
jgi:hypothetical protein